MAPNTLRLFGRLATGAPINLRCQAKRLGRSFGRVREPAVGTMTVGKPVRASRVRAKPLRSVPMISEMGVPARATKRRFSPVATVAILPMNLSSLPRMTSISKSPAPTTVAGPRYQRGSSSILICQAPPAGP
jgi:hypothetical protein